MNAPRTATRHLPPGVWFAAVGVLLAGLALLGPVLGYPGTFVLGAWDSEAAWHIWRHAAWLRTFAEQGPWLRAPEPGLVDPDLANLSPGSTLLGWPAWWVAGGGTAGVALAWNVVYAAAFAGAVGGTWSFVRAWLPSDTSRMAAAAATLIVAFGAFLQQAPDIGRLETAHQFIWPLHLAFLYRATTRLGWWVLPAAATFALLTLQGGFPALFVGAIEVPVAAWCLAQAPRRRWAFGVLVCVAAAGAAALWPWVAANRAFPPASLTAGREGSISVPLLQLLPGGADVPFARGYHEAPYPGAVALLAAVVASVWCRGSRFWLALALATGVMMIGPEARLTADGPVLTTMPVSWLAALPGWDVPATGWARLGTFVPTFLALAIAPAVVGRPRLAATLGLLAALDQVAWRPPWHDAAWDLSVPEGLGSGATVWLPMDERSLAWVQSAEPGARKLPIAERLSLPTLRWVDAVLRGTPEGFRRNDMATRADPPSPGCVARDAGVLTEAGFARLALLADHGDATPVEAVLRAGLGDPDVVTERGVAWNLNATNAECDQELGGQPAREPPGRGTPRHPGGGRHRGNRRR